MKKLARKLILLIIPILLYLSIVYETDTFNVFHYKNIRVTDASFNDNFVKTKNVLDHPDQFNAFILGSSRVANLPKENLPTSLNGHDLYWYNMTCAMGCPKENLETLKTFLANGIKVNAVILGIDEISMYTTYENNSQEMMLKQYQEYEKNPIKFYYSYLKLKPEFSILYQAMTQDDNDKSTAALIYDYGVYPKNCDTSVPGDPLPMAKSLGCQDYPGKENCEALSAIEELKGLCIQNNIDLKIYTSPILQTTYEDAISHGYIDFLKDVAEITDFYNFSGRNQYTTDMRYYYDASHYIPYVGLQIEDVIFDDHKELDVTQFGAYITSDNIQQLCSYLSHSV